MRRSLFRLAVVAVALAGCGQDGASARPLTRTNVDDIPISWTVGAWFIDPADVTGNATDSNPCTSAAAPCLTFAEIAIQWGTYAPRLRQNTTITFLSSQPGDDDPVYLNPYIENGAAVAVVGVLGPPQEVARGTLSYRATKVRANAQLLEAELPAGVQPGQLVVNVSKNSRAWVYRLAAGNSWYLSQPLAAATLPLTPGTAPAEDDTWGPGDGFVVYQPVSVDLAATAPVAGPGGAGNPLTFYQLKVLSPAIEATEAGANGHSKLAIADADVAFVEVSIDRYLSLEQNSYSNRPDFVNVDFTGGLSAPTVSPQAGMSVMAGQVRAGSWSAGGALLDDDLVIGSVVALSGGSYGRVFVDTSAELLVQHNDVTFTQAQGAPVLWGPGSVDAVAQGRLRYPSGAGMAEATFQVGGLYLDGPATADEDAQAPSTTGCSVDGAGTWRCGIAVTAANLDAPVSAGGFAGTAIDPGGSTITDDDGLAPAADAGSADAGSDASGDGGGADATVDGGSGGSLEAGVEAEAAPPAACVYEAGVAPAGPAVCGDGWRDPATEECDDGLGDAGIRRGCTSACGVLDELDIAQLGSDGGLANGPRTLAGGRHPVAAGLQTFAVVTLETPASPPTVALTTFSRKGAATGVVTPMSAGSTVSDQGDPVIAALPCDQYAVAWTDVNGDGDGLGVALRLFDPPAGVPIGVPSFANTTTSFDQYAPDLLWTGSTLVAAWTDTSNADTGPDVRYRTFDATLTPTSDEQTLAATADIEGDVTLAPFEGSWAAAWRDDANGLEQIRVQTGLTDWTIGPAFLPPSVTTKIALAELDASTLLVLYSTGGDPDNSGVASAVSTLQAAIVSLTSPGNVTGTAVPMNATVEGATTALSHAYANAVRVGSTVYASWWVDAIPGSSAGEELWFQPVGWDGTTPSWGGTELALPRAAADRPGNQRRPAMVASTLEPNGALVSAWDDLGGAVSSGEGPGDVVVELVPVPVLRNGAQ